MVLGYCNSIMRKSQKAVLLLGNDCKVRFSRETPLNRKRMSCGSDIRVLVLETKAEENLCLETP